MATNILSVATAATGALSLASSAASSIANLIVATPATTIGYLPQNPVNSGFSLGNILGNILNPSPKSLVFHYEGEQTVSFESDITDHYIQNNSAIQDQIALKPILITTHGFIGELNNVPPPVLASLQSVTQKLGVLNPYVPGISTTAVNAYNTAFQAYQAAQSLANAASSAWSSLSGGGESVIGATGLTKVSGQNLQQTMFQQLYGYWNSRTLFTVQTPWAVFQGMAIYKLRAIQSEETNVITDFELTFKQIRTVASLSSSAIASTPLANAASPVTNIGTQQPQNTGPTVSTATGGL